MWQRIAVSDLTAGTHLANSHPYSSLHTPPPPPPPHKKIQSKQKKSKTGIDIWKQSKPNKSSDYILWATASGVYKVMAINGFNTSELWPLRIQNPVKMLRLWFQWTVCTSLME